MAPRKREHACVEGWRRRFLYFMSVSVTCISTSVTPSLGLALRQSEWQREKGSRQDWGLQLSHVFRKEGRKSADDEQAFSLIKPVKRFKRENSFFSHCDTMYNNGCTWSTTLTRGLERCLRCGSSTWYSAQLFPFQYFYILNGRQKTQAFAVLTLVTFFQWTVDFLSPQRIKEIQTEDQTAFKLAVNKARWVLTALP